MTDLQILTSHLGLLGLGSALYISWILRAFSRRIGDVRKMPTHYRWFDVGSFFIAVALLGQAMLCSIALAGRPVVFMEPIFTLCVFYLPLALGSGINLGVALVYWGWLVHER